MKFLINNYNQETRNWNCFGHSMTVLSKIKNSFQLSLPAWAAVKSVVIWSACVCFVWAVATLPSFMWKVKLRTSIDDEFIEPNETMSLYAY